MLIFFLSSVFAVCGALSFLSGAFPSLANSLNLLEVTLDTNQLSGSIPPLNLPRCVTLTAANNQLSGSLPAGFFHGLPKLLMFDMSSNQLEGTIPPAPAPLTLQLFSLSLNRLTGPLPANITASGLVGLTHAHAHAHARNTLDTSFLSFLLAFRISFGPRPSLPLVCCCPLVSTI